MSLTTMTGVSQQAGGGSNQIIMLVIVVGVFYLLLWLPQSKRAKAQRQLIAGLQVGDEVMTTAGILGKIIELNGNDYVVLAISPQVNVTLQKSSVSVTVPKGTVKW